MLYVLYFLLFLLTVHILKAFDIITDEIFLIIASIIIGIGFLASFLGWLNDRRFNNTRRDKNNGGGTYYDSGDDGGSDGGGDGGGCGGGG